MNYILSFVEIMIYLSILFTLIFKILELKLIEYLNIDEDIEKKELDKIDLLKAKKGIQNSVVSICLCMILYLIFYTLFILHT